ncbi:hypothetical protein BH24ACI1_BH24ACI1_07770 [soil metagenome]
MFHILPIPFADANSKFLDITLLIDKYLQNLAAFHCKVFQHPKNNLYQSGRKFYLDVFLSELQNCFCYLFDIFD